MTYWSRLQQYTSALAILGSLPEFDARSLPLVQRVLLITDGTLTDILEAVFLEHIRLVRIAQHRIDAHQCASELTVSSDEVAIRRTVLLQGTDTSRVYVYASSDPEFRS